MGGASGIGIAMALSTTNSGKAQASDLPGDITDMSASRLSLAIRQREVSCVEVMQAYLARIHRYNPVYNAIVSMVDDDVLIDQARAADQALSKGDYWGWMHGMPYAVKDSKDVQGMPIGKPALKM